MTDTAGPMRKIVRRFQSDTSLSERLECGHEITWVRRGKNYYRDYAGNYLYAGADARRCAECVKAAHSHNEDKWLRYEGDIAAYYDQRIREWMANGMPPAQTAFTAGLGRWVASLIEEAVKADRQRADRATS